MKKRRNHLLKAALLLILFIGGFSLLQPWIHSTTPSATEDSAPVSAHLRAPIAEPTLERLDQIAQYTRGKPLPAPPSSDISLSPLQLTGHIRGSADAPFSMIEYGSVTNEYTRLIHPALIEFLGKNKANLNWIFHHYPTSESDIDEKAAEAMECAAEQKGDKAFWTVLDLALTEKNVTEDALYRLGASTGVDVTKQKQCVQQQEFYDHVLQDKFTAQSDTKIYGAPSFIFVNTKTGSFRIVEGINTLDYLQQTLDRMIQSGE
jgi:protein-disulfide isomerase